QPISNIIILEKNYYEINQTINIKLKYTIKDAELFIKTPNHNYKFLGSLEENIKFFLEEEGNYEVTLIKNQQVLDKKNFSVNKTKKYSEIITQNNYENYYENKFLTVEEKKQDESYYEITNNTCIITEKNTYYLGEKIAIKVNKKSFQNSKDSNNLKIITEQETYSMLGELR
ncbi:MAG: hypothetical protein QXU20_03760, partial [Candidatus Woesearchaeota archaeon]